MPVGCDELLGVSMCSPFILYDVVAPLGAR